MAAKVQSAVWRPLSRMQPCCVACSMRFQAVKVVDGGVGSLLVADKKVEAASHMP